MEDTYNQLRSGDNKIAGEAHDLHALAPLAPGHDAHGHGAGGEDEADDDKGPNSVKIVEPVDSLEEIVELLVPKGSPRPIQPVPGSEKGNPCEHANVRARGGCQSANATRMHAKNNAK